MNLKKVINNVFSYTPQKSYSFSLPDESNYTPEGSCEDNLDNVKKYYA